MRGMRAMLVMACPPGASWLEWNGPDILDPGPQRFLTLSETPCAGQLSRQGAIGGQLVDRPHSADSARATQPWAHGNSPRI